MKRGTPSHPKTRALAARLGIPVWGAVGLLEMLWHFTAEYTPQGDVGRYSDAQIAEAIGWTADASALVVALIEVKYLDRDRAHRLLVHDFHEHAEQSVKRRLERNTQEFLTTHVRPVTSRRLAMTSQKLAMASLARGEGEGIGSCVVSSSEDGESEGKEPTVAASSFAAFWAQYPRREGKADARRAWLKLAPDPPLVATMLAALATQRAGPRWQDDEGRFVPHAATWLHGRRWEDEVPAPTPPVRSFAQIHADALAAKRKAAACP